MEQLTVPYQEQRTLSDTPTGKIGHFLWLDNGYRPETAFFLAYNKDGLRVRLQAAEPTLRAAAWQDDGPVWEDNCLEFFFQPFETNPEYMNFECNALGFMTVQKGAARENRVIVTEQVKPQLGLTVTIQPGQGWSVDFSVPFTVIEALYGRPFRPQPGERFRCNAYCCGDSAEPPHYGAWNPIDLPSPDFHQSSFFGQGVWG